MPQGLNGRIVTPRRTTTAAASTRRSAARPATAASSRRPSTTARRTTSTTRSDRSCTSPGRSANGTYASYEGIPITEGEVLERRAVHDNSNLHVASMGFWALMVVRDDSVEPCAPMPKRHRRGHQAEALRPHPEPRVEGAAAGQAGRQAHAVHGGKLARSATTSSARAASWPGAASTVTWRFAGAEPHTVTVANGPRGFSSRYTGQTCAAPTSYTPTVKGTYRLTCLVHPTPMGQTLKVE